MMYVVGVECNHVFLNICMLTAIEIENVHEIENDIELDNGNNLFDVNDTCY